MPDTTDKAGLSTSGQGVAVWLGEEIVLRLTWEQARQLEALLRDAVDRR